MLDTWMRLLLPPPPPLFCPSPPAAPPDAAASPATLMFFTPSVISSTTIVASSYHAAPPPQPDRWVDWVSFLRWSTSSPLSRLVSSRRCGGLVEGEERVNPQSPEAAWAGQRPRAALLGPGPRARSSSIATFGPLGFHVRPN